MQLLGEALLLVLVANSAPILIRQIPWLEKFTYPVDCGAKFFDGRRLLGTAKTWRGVFAAIFATMLCSIVLQLGWFTGVVVGILAMLGDSLSSFIKRRLAMPPSHMALGLDQIPESLLPLLYLHYLWHFNGHYIWVLVVMFIALELVLSRILFRLHIRKRPY